MPLVPVFPSGENKITYTGPTTNITEVANHIQAQAKSLTSFVTVAPGLALTQPVTISIAYLSLWRCRERAENANLCSVLW